MLGFLLQLQPAGLSEEGRQESRAVWHGRCLPLLPDFNSVPGVLTLASEPPEGSYQTDASLPPRAFDSVEFVFLNDSPGDTELSLSLETSLNHSAFSR